MTKKTKKLLAILATVAMLFSVMPVTAFADSDNIDSAEMDNYNFEAGDDETQTINVTTKAIDTETDVELTFSDEAPGNWEFADVNESGTTGSGNNVTIDAVEVEDRVVTITIDEAEEDGTFEIEDLEITGRTAAVVDDPLEIDGVAVDGQIDVYPQNVASSGQSRVVDVDPDDPDVGEAAEFELRVRDRFANRICTDKIPGNTTMAAFYVQSSRDTEDINVIGDGNATTAGVDVSNAWEIIDTEPEDGVLKFEMSSFASGEYTVRVGNSQSEDADEVRSLWRDGEQTIDVAPGDAVVQWIDVDPGANEARAGDEVEVTVLLEDEAGREVEGEEVEFFYEQDGESDVSIGTEETDSNGEASMSFYPEAADGYDIWVEVDGDEYYWDDAEEEYAYFVSPASGYDIFADDDTKTVEYEETEKVHFIIEDRYGNEYEEDNFPGGDFRNLVDEDGNEVYQDFEDIIDVEYVDADGDSYDYDDAEDYNMDDDGLYVEIEFDVEGEWTVEAYITGTGRSAETTVNVGEFGDIDYIEIDPGEDALRAPDNNFDRDGDITDADDVWDEPGSWMEIDVDEVDEAGISRAVDLEDLSYSVDDRTMARFYEYDDDLYLYAREDASGVVTITVVHDDGFEDSVEVPIAGDPVELDVAWDVEEEELDGTATITLLDDEGNRTPFVGDRDGDEDYNVITPADVSTFDVEDFDDGEYSTTFGLEADDFGTYTIRILTDMGVSTTFNAEFFEEVIDRGAEHVQMDIGATTYTIDGVTAEMDAAPFIEDGVTFVPVRFLAEALNADADWTADPVTGLTETVTLEREDLLITITIGEDTFDVLCKDTDETETVETRAPAQIVDPGRTVLPFREIGEAFGVEVDFSEDPETGRVDQVWFQQ